MIELKVLRLSIQGVSTMHVEGFLHKMLSPVMHKKRLETLKLFVSTLLISKKLSLTELGREISQAIQERSGIRRADRFLGNKNLHLEKESIQAEVAKRLLMKQSQPWIIVDWSGIPNTNLYVLRAALTANGRALTLYEEVHPEKKQNKHSVHKKFLHNLRSLVPSDSKPIIITDGGFHNTWFKDVLSLGWDYLGRNRAGNGKKYQLKEGGQWVSSENLSRRSTRTPKYFGRVNLCKKGTLSTHVYLYKSSKKNRVTKNKYGKKKKGTNSKKYRRTAYEPWILTTSLSGQSYLFAKRVIKIYKKRMQIEEGFRDLKSTSTGFSLRHAYSKDKNRVEILLLIAMLASMIAWVVGLIGEKKGLHYQFQSNSVKDRRVLSLFYLGCKLIKKKIPIPMIEINAAMSGGLKYAD